MAQVAKRDLDPHVVIVRYTFPMPPQLHIAALTLDRKSVGTFPSIYPHLQIVISLFVI